MLKAQHFIQTTSFQKFKFSHRFLKTKIYFRFRKILMSDVQQRITKSEYLNNGKYE